MAEQSDTRTKAATLPPDARVLIVRFTSLGDVVKCTALPRLVKRAYPRAHVTFVTAEAQLELIRHNPHVDRAIGFERRGGLRGLLRLARSLGAERWHLVVDVHHSLRSRVLCAFVRAPRTRYSKRTLQRWLLIHFRIDTYRRAWGKEEDFLAGLAPYGVTDDGRGTELDVSPLDADPALREAFAAERATLERWRAEGRPVVGAAPVAAWELKRWPLAHWRALLERVVAEGGRVVLFGGPGDTDVAALADALGEGALSLVGRTTLLQSAWFAARCDLMAANDTGMGHIAEAVGRDSLVFFGPTSRELGYFPVRPGSRVLERLPMTCRPCTRNGKGRCTHPLPRACLALIGPEAALAAIHDMLAGRPEPPGR